MIRKRGRPQKVNVDLLVNCFQKYKNDIINNNQISSKNSNVWVTMSKEMNETITAFFLYTYACNNIYNIKNILLNKEKNLTESSINNSMESSKGSSESLTTDDKTDQTFEISVSKQEFDSIIEERMQKRTERNLDKKVSYRRILRFRSGIYQEFFSKLFWKTRRLQSCVINYINHYIPQNINGGYLNGYCRCGSTIQIKFELRDCNNNVILLCSFKKGKKKLKIVVRYIFEKKLEKV